MRANAFACLASVALFVTAFPVMKAKALVTEPVLFDAPVPDKWRATFSRFLRELGVADVETTIVASKARDFSGVFDETGPARFIFRIVHPSACTREQDECMTAIGYIDDDRFIAEAIFYAGDKISVGDVSPRILGVSSSRPVSFIGKTSAVSVVKTAKGMLIVSQPVRPSP